jgi:hypothetical protein
MRARELRGRRYLDFFIAKRVYHNIRLSPAGEITGAVKNGGSHPRHLYKPLMPAWPQI